MRGDCEVPVYYGNKKTQEESEDISIFPAGQAPGREIHPGGLSSAEVVKGQKAHLLIGHGTLLLKGNMTLLCKSF